MFSVHEPYMSKLPLSATVLLNPPGWEGESKAGRSNEEDAYSQTQQQGLNDDCKNTARETRV